MRIAVVGAAGFIGQTLGRVAAAAGHEALGFDVAPAADGGHWRSFQITDAADGSLSMPDRPDAVFYLAQSPFYRADHVRFDDLCRVNVRGALHAGAAARDAHAALFAYASTGNVYQPSFEPLGELCPLRRDDPYALSKVLGEEAIAQIGGDMSVTAVRLFGVFGPGQQRMLAAGLRQRIAAGRSVVLQPSGPELAGAAAGQPSLAGRPGAVGRGDRGDGPAALTGGLRISLLYSLDVARCLLALAELARSGGRPPGVLNLAGPRAISIRELALAIGAAIGIEPVFEVSGATRQFDLVADISLMRRVLSPTFTDFAEAIRASFRAP